MAGGGNHAYPRIVDLLIGTIRKIFMDLQVYMGGEVNCVGPGSIQEYTHAHTTVLCYQISLCPCM